MDGPASWVPKTLPLGGSSLYYIRWTFQKHAQHSSRDRETLAGNRRRINKKHTHTQRERRRRRRRQSNGEQHRWMLSKKFYWFDLAMTITRNENEVQHRIQMSSSIISRHLLLGRTWLKMIKIFVFWGRFPISNVFFVFFFNLQEETKEKLYAPIK